MMPLEAKAITCVEISVSDPLGTHSLSIHLLSRRIRGSHTKAAIMSQSSAPSFPWFCRRVHTRIDTMAGQRMEKTITGT